VDERLKSLSKKRDHLSTVLFIQDGEREGRKERLLSWAEAIESQSLSEAKGSIVFLTPKDESYQESVKVDDVRDLMAKLSLRSWSLDIKRYVLIPFVENLTASSSNALLKVLEEPPEGTIFLLMSSTRSQVLDTVLSRSLIVNMPSVKKENYDIHQNAFYVAFFKEDVSKLKNLKKSETQKEWTEFYSESLEFIRMDKIKDAPTFFKVLEAVTKRLKVHTDNKWIASFIQRNYIEV
jgi:DNA polymerase III delta prime subunit